MTTTPPKILNTDEAVSVAPAIIPTAKIKSVTIIAKFVKSRVEATFSFRWFPKSCNPKTHVRKNPTEIARTIKSDSPEFHATTSKLCFITEYAVDFAPKRKSTTRLRSDFSEEMTARSSAYVCEIVRIFPADTKSAALYAACKMQTDAAVKEKLASRKIQIIPTKITVENAIVRLKSFSRPARKITTTKLRTNKINIKFV